MRFELFIRRVLWNKAEKTVNRFNTVEVLDDNTAKADVTMYVASLKLV